MNTHLRWFFLFLVIFTSSAFAGPIQSLILAANTTSAPIPLQYGELLTVISFTADGSTAAGGARGTVNAQGLAGKTPISTTILRSYDPENANEQQPPPAVISGIGSDYGSVTQVSFTAAQKATTFITYRITQD
jgi:hypothetical protein